MFMPTQSPAGRRQGMHNSQPVIQMRGTKSGLPGRRVGALKSTMRCVSHGQSASEGEAPINQMQIDFNSKEDQGSLNSNPKKSEKNSRNHQLFYLLFIYFFLLCVAM